MIQVQARDAIDGGITKTLLDPLRLGEYLLENAPYVASYSVEAYGLISVFNRGGEIIFLVWIDGAPYVLINEDILTLCAV